MARPRIHEAKQAEIEYLWQLGHTVREISNIVGVSKSTVHRMIKR